MLERPKARTEGLFHEWVDGDLVIYDGEHHAAHSVSGAAAAVWERCDGSTSVADLARELDITPELVERALAELARCGLLEGSAAAGLSRRELGKRLARVGGAAFAAPLVYSVAIGPAMAAASTPCSADGVTVTNCSNQGSLNANATCCSGECYHTGNGGPKFCAPATCVVSGGACTTNADCCSTTGGATNQCVANACAS